MKSEFIGWRARLASFRYAGRGLRWLLVTQPNAWVHAVATVAVVGLGTISRLSPHEWALLLIALGLVWSAEAFNTAIEHLGDAVSTERHPRVGQAKDLAAAGVLLAAATALALGACVFGPRWWG